VMQVPTTAIKDQGTVTKLSDPSLAITSDIQVIDLNADQVLEMEFLAGTNLPAHLKQKTDVPDSVAWGNFDAKSRGYLINESALRKLGWENPQDAIGQQINWSIGTLSLSHGPIAGVISDFHQESLVEKIRPLVLTYEPLWTPNILIKTNTDQALQWHDKLEHFWQKEFPGEPLQWSYLDVELERMYQSEKRQLQLITVLTAMAIFIAFVGLYVMIMYTVKRRLTELAIRKVLGSRWSDQLVLLGKGYFVIALASMLLAFPLVYWLLQEWLDGFAYHVPIHGAGFVIAGSLLLFVVVIVLAYQVFKNARANPADTLVTE
ncbi:MAG: FtsX-like permease family protein, partial [Bacteroidota bacterium]